jgi:hypothetical protein
MPIQIRMKWSSEGCASPSVLRDSAGVAGNVLGALDSLAGVAFLDLTDAVGWEGSSAFEPWPFPPISCSSIGTGWVSPLAPGGIAASSGSAGREWRVCQASFSLRTC